MARKTTFLAGLIFLLSSLLFAQGEFYGPVYIIGDDGRLYIDHIPDTITASYLAVIDDGWLKKLDIDNLELDTSNIAGLYDYLNAKSDTGHIHDTSDVIGLHDMLAGKSDVGHDHDTSDVNNLSLYLGQKLDVSDSSDLARKVHVHDTSNVTGLSLYLGQKLDVTDTSDLARKIHDHTISDITNLQDALDLKLDVTELDNFYTKTNLQTSGQSQVHWGNVTNAPSFITGIDWDEIGGNQSLVNISGFNNDAGYLTSLPVGGYDDRYLKLTGGTLTGDVTFNASTEYANVTDLGNVAPIKIPNFRTTANNMFVPFLHTSTYIQTGYRKHVSIGSYRTGYQWDGGIYFAQGGNDSYPTELFLMEYGGNLKFINSSGTSYKFYNENFKPQWNDIGSKPSVFPPDDHNHSASNINSGTLSNDRLSFNPDYFVQGENSRRTINFNAANPIDNFKHSTFFRIDTDDTANPTGTEQYYGVKVQHPTAESYSVEIAGRVDNEKIFWGGLNSSGRQPWREIWHSGNLDTANIARRNADNVFTGVNTFSDTVKVARLKPVNSNFIHIDLGQDVKNYGVTFRHIDAPYSKGAITMYAKSYFDIKSDGLMQLISGEKVHIEGGDSVSISKNVNTIKMLMATDNKVTIGKVGDTILPLNYDLADTLMLGRKYGVGVLGFGGTDGLIGGDSPNLFGYSYDFQEDPSLAGNLTYTATKHNFNGNIVYGGNPSIIHSEFESIGYLSQTLNPTKGVYVCGGSTTGQEITLGTTGVENGQTVKILKASDLLAGVRYGAPGNYYWRAIGHYGAAEFIHYNGVWFCHGAEYIP